MLKRTRQPATPELIAEAGDTRTPPDRLRELAAYAELAQHLAANPAAPASLLIALSHTFNDQVQSAMAANPNTPPELLSRLAARFPDAFLRNPVLPLLLIEQGAFLTQLGISRLRVLIFHPQVPAEILRLLVEAPGVSRLYISDEARLHVKLAGELGAGWEQVAEHELWRLPRWEIASRYLAQSPQTPVAILRQLAGSLQWRIRRSVARNPSSDAEAQYRLAEDPELAVRQALTRNAQLDAALSDRLAEDPEPSVRQVIARRQRGMRVWSAPPQEQNDSAIYLSPQTIQLSQLIAALSQQGGLSGLLAASALLYPVPDPSKSAVRQELHSWIERLLLVYDPGLPHNQLLRLGDDTHVIVRAAARAELARKGSPG